MNEPETKIINIGLVTRPDPPVRSHFNEQELSRLVDSIEENGILVPLMVRPVGDKFEVIDGDRRLAAAWKAGVREIPVMVYALSDEQTHIQRMLANIDRHDPDPVSEARYIAQVINAKTFTVEEFAKKLGRTIEWIGGRLTIAEMPPYMQDALESERISLGVCMELYQIEDPKTCERYFSEALRNGMTVHAAKVSRLMVNEAIIALRDRGEVVTEENIPKAQSVPKVHCAITGDLLYITETRMVRVGISNYEEWKKNVEKSPTQ